MEINVMTRTRHSALSASSPALTMWRALPVTTGAVRPDAVAGPVVAAPVVAADATATAPGQPAWSPPI